VSKFAIKEGSKKKVGYIAMLAIDPAYRRKGLGRKLVDISINRMKENGADEVVLETEEQNVLALKLYESTLLIRHGIHSHEEAAVILYE
jgi:peptide alpha-N-acetyltransferase